MGYYTEVELNIRLKDDTDAEVMKILKYMAQRSLPDYTGPSFIRDLATRIDFDDLIIPEHGLFVETKESRWQYMFTSDLNRHSYLTDYRDYKFLTFYGNFKNYNHKIQKFCDWITPYIHDSYKDGDALGYCGEIGLITVMEGYVSPRIIDLGHCKHEDMYS